MPVRVLTFNGTNEVTTKWTTNEYKKWKWKAYNMYILNETETYQMILFI